MRGRVVNRAEAWGKNALSSCLGVLVVLGCLKATLHAFLLLALFLTPSGLASPIQPATCGVACTTAGAGWCSLAVGLRGTFCMRTATGFVIAFWLHGAMNE